ncbi:hypothetical protein UFOVP860_75 [uncultured Caudovirales phage]|uniref:Uncharacterized protein n=1 Tax=uncultured Caudovirales phage TaxID=2100421 RepID=A0A6J5T429_9CAUD|nr:hypothetical protein UFOVP860_75 [uncultured Caudovirales phage]CAB4195458.1 hypothetical protein UFOVP1293_36 [uncultured Caudovirales phage]CAB4222522.1 hypothetical protein UFOVP1644_54 [uncultured Caudovirales phage]
MNTSPFLDGYRSTVDPTQHRDSPPAELIVTAQAIAHALRWCNDPGSDVARGIAAGIVAKLYGVDLSGGRA